MNMKVIGLIGAATIVGARVLFAATDVAEVTLTLQEKNYPLKRALAFETTIDNEEAVSVVFSNKAIPAEKIKEARENDKQSGDTDFGRPYLKLIFKKTGEFK